MLLNACNTPVEETTSNTVLEEEPLSQQESAIETSDFSSGQYSPWEVDPVTDSIFKIHPVDSDTLTAEQVISWINQDYADRVYCELVEIQHDTAFVKIADSEHLTQRMGTTGAYGYMITATFTITELEGIEYVDFDFGIGDHATPGTYSRKYFEEHLEANK